MISSHVTYEVGRTPAAPRPQTGARAQAPPRVNHRTVTPP
jgi:hypothetical protein